MRLGRRAAEDNFKNNNYALEDGDSNTDDNQRWRLYDGLDLFVEEWGEQLRGFNCWDAILKTLTDGVYWTFGKLYLVWKVSSNCRKVEPFQGSVGSLSTDSAEDEEFNGNFSRGRRTNSCEF